MSAEVLLMATPVTTVELYEDEGYGGIKKELNKESQDWPDLTKEFTNGVSSIILKENACKWIVFTQKDYHGPKVTLEPGRHYRTRDDMGLDKPVRSMRMVKENDKVDESEANKNA